MYIYDDPSADENGEFSDGDPGLGIPRSVLKAAWPNMVQRELLNLVTGAGLEPSAVDFDQVLKAVLALSASNGFETGDIKYSYRAVPSPGWLTIDGRTIGNSDSGATALASDLCHGLFVFLWDSFSDALCPVSGGRGVNAEQDWLANKTIQLFDDRGEFHRIWDNGRGIDVGRALGEWRDSQLKSHDHGINLEGPGLDRLLSNKNFVENWTGDQPENVKTGPAGGDDTYPRSRAVNVFIKL